MTLMSAVAAVAALVAVTGLSGQERGGGASLLCIVTVMAGVEQIGVRLVETGGHVVVLEHGPTFPPTAPPWTCVSRAIFSAMSRSSCSSTYATSPTLTIPATLLARGFAHPTRGV